MFVLKCEKGDDGIYHFDGDFSKSKSPGELIDDLVETIVFITNFICENVDWRKEAEYFNTNYDAKISSYEEFVMFEFMHAIMDKAWVILKLTLDTRRDTYTYDEGLPFWKPQ